MWLLLVALFFGFVVSNGFFIDWLLTGYTSLGDVLAVACLPDMVLAMMLLAWLSPSNHPAASAGLGSWLHRVARDLNDPRAAGTSTGVTWVASSTVSMLKSGYRGGLLIAYLSALCFAAPAAGVQAATEPEDPLEVMDRRDRCLEDLDWASRNPGCQEFPEVRAQPAAKDPVRFCRDSSASARPCECDSNGSDARCRFRICGYQPGHYKDSSLLAFALEVAEVIRNWQDEQRSVLVLTRFVGFADGTNWGISRMPKPQPIPPGVAHCLLMAKAATADLTRDLGATDRLDAELAILRGCALEEALDDSMPGFEFDIQPTFSFKARKAGVANPSIRAAELEIVVENGCERLAP